MAVTRNKLSADLRQRLGAFVASRVASPDRLCVGLSGGCDSVVLLHLLASLGFGARLSAVHVHHGLSPNADQWQTFCIDYCQKLGVPLMVCQVTVDLAAGLGVEAAARQARYAAFEATVDSEVLLLAHHRGDQTETLLFNLLRGSGVSGLSAMRSERQAGCLQLLRPLLDVSRAEIEAYAAAHGLEFVDDESNADRSLTRNFLRHDVLPLLKQRFPAMESSFAQAAGHFAEADELLNELAAADWQQICQGDAARMRHLRQLSLPRLKNLLRYRLRYLGWQMPVAARLNEFARQLQSAGADRHPALRLREGEMAVKSGLLHWLVYQ